MDQKSAEEAHFKGAGGAPEHPRERERERERDRHHQQQQQYHLGHLPSLAHNSACQPLTSPCYIHAGLEQNSSSSNNAGGAASIAGTAGDVIGQGTSTGTGTSPRARRSSSNARASRISPSSSSAQPSLGTVSAASASASTDIASPDTTIGQAKSSMRLDTSSSASASAPAFDSAGSSARSPLNEDDLKTPQIQEWGRQVRRAYFEENPVRDAHQYQQQPVPHGPGSSTPWAATGSGSGSGSGIGRSSEQRSLSFDDHSGSERTVGRLRSGARRAGGPTTTATNSSISGIPGEEVLMNSAGWLAPGGVLHDAPHRFHHHSAGGGGAAGGLGLGAGAATGAAAQESGRRASTAAGADRSHNGHHSGGEGEDDDEEEEQSARREGGQDDDDDDDDDEALSDGSSYILSSEEEEDDDRVRSLTRQLAETAVGVREMSKQLGRARVKSTIQSVLIITKARDNHLIKLTRDLAIWLMTTPRNGLDRGLVVYVDSQLRNSKRFDAAGIQREHPHLFEPVEHPIRLGRSNSTASASASSVRSFTGSESDYKHARSYSSTGSNSGYANANHGNGNNRHHASEGQLRYWTAEMCSRSPHLFDFVVTLGGDGTVLFCSWLFQRIVPPVLPFSLGSLGFLTNFNFSDYEKVMTSALEQGIRVNLRMRFTATVYRAVLPTSETAEADRRRAIKSGKTGEIIMRNIQEGGWDTIESPCPPRGGSNVDPSLQEKCKKRDKEVMCFSTRPVETFEVLNDLVVDRGPSPYVSLLEIFGDEQHMTTAQADGICIATPTGSTAYSLAAGGSLAHPEIPAILITPICPHTLSFRPMLLPDSMEVRIAVPYNSRSTAWASFDGRGRVELKQGDHIKVSASRYPFPTVCAQNQSIDWFESISRTLKWNQRQRQKSFVVVEEEAEQKEKKEEKDDKDVPQPPKAETLERRKEAAGTNADDKSGPSKLDRAEASALSDDDEAFDIDDKSEANTRSSSPQTGSGHHHHHHSRRRSSHRARMSMSETNLAGSSEQPPMVGRRSADALPRLSALSHLSSINSSSTHSRDRSSRSSVSGVSMKEKGKSASGSGENSPMPHMSPDRFGKAGPPEPPRALSDRHFANADFRLPPARFSESYAPADSDEAQQAGSSEGLPSSGDGRESPAVSSRRLSREKIGPLAAASQAVRGAANALTPSSLLSSKRRGKEGRQRGNNPDHDGEGQQSALGDRGAGSDAYLSRKESGGGGTALVVYGEDESDSDDGIAEQ